MVGTERAAGVSLVERIRRPRRESLSRPVSFSTVRRLLVKTIVERWPSIRPMIRSSMAGQIVPGGPEQTTLIGPRPDAPGDPGLAPAGVDDRDRPRLEPRVSPSSDGS